VVREYFMAGSMRQRNMLASWQQGSTKRQKRVVGLNNPHNKLTSFY
jgi:hypothetical protein